jgi:hypothetical protein
MYVNIEFLNNNFNEISCRILIIREKNTCILTIFTFIFPIQYDELLLISYTVTVMRIFLHSSFGTENVFDNLWNINVIFNYKKIAVSCVDF